MEKKKIKEIREELGLTQMVILGTDKEGTEYVHTHRDTLGDATEAAKQGNEIKKYLGWTKKLCNLKPLQRICSNCEFWQKQDSRSRLNDSVQGKCMHSPVPVFRHSEDTACHFFSPNK